MSVLHWQRGNYNIYRRKCQAQARKHMKDGSWNIWNTENFGVFPYRLSVVFVMSFSTNVHFYLHKRFEGSLNGFLILNRRPVSSVKVQVENVATQWQSFKTSIDVLIYQNSTFLLLNGEVIFVQHIHRRFWNEKVGASMPDWLRDTEVDSLGKILCTPCGQ